LVDFQATHAFPSLQSRDAFFIPLGTVNTATLDRDEDEDEDSEATDDDWIEDTLPDEYDAADEETE